MLSYDQVWKKVVSSKKNKNIIRFKKQIESDIKLIENELDIKTQKKYDLDIQYADYHTQFHDLKKKYLEHIQKGESRKNEVLEEMLKMINEKAESLKISGYQIDLSSIKFEDPVYLQEMENAKNT